MAKETKYLLADTDEEVLLGDVIVQTLVKNFSNGRRIEREIEFKLTEETVPYALDMGLIEEAELENKEEENKNGLLDFGNEDCPFKEMLDAVVEDQETLEKRVDKLEENFGDIFNETATLENKMKEFKEWQASFLAKYYVDKAAEKKTPSSKKK